MRHVLSASRTCRQQNVLKCGGRHTWEWRICVVQPQPRMQVLGRKVFTEVIGVGACFLFSAVLLHSGWSKLGVEMGKEAW